MNLSTLQIGGVYVFTLTAVTIASFAPLRAEEEMYCDSEYVLELPEDQDRAQLRIPNAFYDDFWTADRWKGRLRDYKAYLEYEGAREDDEAPRYPFDDDDPTDAHHSHKACVEVRGSGPIEVEVRLVGPLVEEAPPMPYLWFHTWHANIDFFPTTSFRWVIHETHKFGFRTAMKYAQFKPFFERHIEADTLDQAEAALEGLESLEIVVTARRIHEYCWMDAYVTGDVPRSRRFFGDGAYFNTAVYPVKKGMMVGTIGETQTHDTVAGFGTVDTSKEGALDLAAQLGLISEEEAEQAAEDIEHEEGNPEEEQAESGGFAEWAQQQLRAEDPSEGDNFGLNLADIKADETPETIEGAAAIFARGFTLTLSGRADLEQGPMEEPVPRQVDVTPSTVTATVGLDDEGDRIPFEMIDSSSPQIEFTNVNDDFITGLLVGELETKGHYTVEGITSSPRKLRIKFVAHFAARRGSLSCMQ